MKQMAIKAGLFALLFSAGLQFSSCKSKEKNQVDTNVNVDSNAAVPATPIEVSADDALSRGVTDATKDYPEVQTKVDSGVVYVTGSIERARWQKLKPALDALSPKRVNAENLTIK